MLNVLFAVLVFPSCCAENGKLEEGGGDICGNGLNCSRRPQDPSPCPAGFSCLGDGSAPVPCPEGSFRSLGSLPPHRCLHCPVDFFNHKPGQAACFPCGSEAVQPKEGQKACKCLRRGRIFQPSDAQCPCARGYKNPTNDRRWDCVKEAYDICRDRAARNQEGECLTREGWTQYCTDKICTQGFQGYDRVLGLCLCQAERLDSVCNERCRWRQRDTLRLVCDQEPRLSVMYRNGSQDRISLEEITPSLQVLGFHTQSDCISAGKKGSQPVYIVKTNGRGFWGVYNPEPEMLHYFLTSGGIASANGWQPMTSSGIPGNNNSAFSWPLLQQPPNTTLKITDSGIFNPTTCLKIHDVLMFIVSKEHYPVYDVNNLYNTNLEFDWGGFRRLEEDVTLTLGSSPFLLFFYRFRDPGTYVLSLSSNRHRRMYVRVMPSGGLCYDEGPFFPTTPRHVIQAGIALVPDLVLKPDWQAIVGIIVGLLFLLLLCLLAVFLCQVFGWSRKRCPDPRFRQLQLKYNLDKYSSKESKLVALKKYHPGIRKRGSEENNCSPVEKREGGFEIWDLDEEVDLDSFNTNVFFEILVTQSMAVTSKLSQFKEELKLFYHKLLEEAASLRDLWVARVGAPDGAEFPSDGLVGHCTKMKQQVEEEILRRRHLGSEYEANVSRQLRFLTEELKSQETQWVAFHSAFREATRLTEALADALSSGEESKPDHHRLLSLIDAASHQMSSVVIKESHRLMQWGILGEGTGGHLVSKEKTRLLTKEELVGPDGAVKAHELLHQVAATGLVVPRDDAVMLLANHSMKVVPADHFLHPGTGKVLPIAGNVGFDPISSKLVPMVDLAPGELRNSASPIFPYVPYPTSPGTGLPVKSNLPPLQPEKVFCLGGVMQDPASGLEVPILAVTLHPQTGQRLALGGTYLNPLTGTVSPLEIGAPMRAPEGGAAGAAGGRVVPILGVALDSDTGAVLPLGGLQGPSETLLLPGDSFVEPLSGKAARAQGLCLQQGKVVPSGGGFQAALEGNLLLSQMRAAKALQEYKTALWEEGGPTGDGQRALKAAEGDMRKALSCKTQHWMHWMRKAEEQQEWASRLKSTGGKLGMVRYPGTGLWVPALFGMGIPDPGGSGLTVPLLGVECDWKSGRPVPVAGSMEDADGKGLVPLAIGSRTIDPITEETGPVIGAQIDPWTTAVIPVVQSLGSLPRGSPDPDLTAALEKERAAKQRSWNNQREKEEELFKELDFLRLDVSDAAKEGKMTKLRYKDKLRPAEEIYRSLDESSNQEAQRRANRPLTALWDSKLSLQMRVEVEERGQEARVRLLLRKTLEKLVQFVRKVQLEEGRLQMQLKEAERQRGSGHQAQETARKTTLHLVAAFEEHIAKHQANVDRAYCRLEYLRCLLDTVALQTKDLLSGSSQCFVNYPSWRFYGAAPQGTWDVLNRKLIPLLRSVLEALKGSKRIHSSPEMLVSLGSEKGYSSRSTLKVSETAGEAFRAETRQEGSPVAAALSPPSGPSPKRSQLLQEIHARILLEKHAGEMLHLELSLMAEEIHMITCFWESSRPKKKLGSKPGPNVEGSNEWNGLLKELAEHHRHSEEELCRRHWEEAQRAGFGPEGIALKDGALFSPEEILQSLALLRLDLQKADSSLTIEAAEENSETQVLEAKLSPMGSASQRKQAVAMKMVRQEALMQIRTHRVLERYNSLQRQTCPEEILQAVGHFCGGENVARDVVRSVEKQQVERAMTFLQKQSNEEQDPSASCSEREEAKLRKLQALIRTELQMEIEEKLEAKETEVVLGALKHNTSLSAHGTVCLLLRRRHLRQAALLLEASLELQETGSKAQGDGSSVEGSALDGPLVDQNTKAIVRLLKEKKEYVSSRLQLLQASQMLQLRERQFQETVQKLKAHSSDQHLEEANQIASELQGFRQHKAKELEEKLRTCLKSPRTQEGPSKNLNDLQRENHERKGKERWQSFQQTWLVELEESYRGQISEEKAKLQDQLEKGELKKWSKRKLLREHDETVTFLDKAFQQETHKRQVRMEKERGRRRSHPHDGSPPAPDSGSPQERQQPNPVEEDNVFCLLAEYLKILKHTELLLMLRTVLLDPRFRPLQSDGSEADRKLSSQILALLNEVNCQIRTSASAAGLLDNQHPKRDRAGSFQDVMDIQMIPKSGGSLVPLLPSSLSEKEFVIYHYGIVILQFLRPLVGGPEIDLCLASSVPSSNAPGNAFQNTFYYQRPGHKLFVLRECLSCVGGFVLLLVHCLAHVAAQDLSHDSKPAFRRLFHQALKACLGELFFLRLQASAVSEDGKSAARMINEAFLKREGPPADEERDPSSGLSGGNASPSAVSEETHLTSSSEERERRLVEDDS